MQEVSQGERELYVKTINSPDWEAKRVKLSLGKENIYQYYKRGKTYPYVNGMALRSLAQARKNL